MAGLRNLVKIRLSDFLISFGLSHKKHKLILILVLSTIWQIIHRPWHLCPQGDQEGVILPRTRPSVCGPSEFLSEYRSVIMLCMAAEQLSLF